MIVREARTSFSCQHLELCHKNLTQDIHWTLLDYSNDSQPCSLPALTSAQNVLR